VDALLNSSIRSIVFQTGAYCTGRQHSCLIRQLVKGAQRYIINNLLEHGNNSFWSLKNVVLELKRAAGASTMHVLQFACCLFGASVGGIEDPCRKKAGCKAQASYMHKDPSADRVGSCGRTLIDRSKDLSMLAQRAC
jgi:hypothetical protein